MSLPERENAARVWRPCRMGDYCLTKQTATHRMRLRRACSAVKSCSKIHEVFSSQILSRGPSCGLATFYEIFYEKSIFFCRKILLRHSGPNMLFLLAIFVPSGLPPPQIPPGARFYKRFFHCRRNALCGRTGTGTQACACIVIFFTIYTAARQMTSVLPCPILGLPRSVRRSACP